LSKLPGDLPSYTLRFILSLLLFGVIPFGTMILMGNSFKDMGLRRSQVKLSGLWTVFFLLGFAVVAALNAFAGPMSDFYPYSNHIKVMAAQGDWWIVPVHFLLYILLYYLPWEFLFRGIMIMPYIRILDKVKGLNPREAQILMISIASFQAIPSAMIHIQHPFPETIAALPFGIFLGYLAVKTRSIIPGLVLHIVTGITLDFILIIK